MNFSTGLLHEDPGDAPLTKAIREDPFICTKDGGFAKYKGLPHKFKDVFKWKAVYQEITAQYQRFKDVTEGRGDYSHIDFHLWYNLTWPVAVAEVFTRKNDIKSVRYIGLHQMKSKRFRLFKAISWNPRVKYIPATNIDYFVSKKLYLKDYSIIELYCHPNYKNGVFLDDSPSCLKHDRQSILNQIQSLKDVVNIDYVSWNEIV